MANDERRGTGALTGATGSLTPDDVDEPFVPAEQREIADPRHTRDVPDDPAHRMEERPETVEVPAPAPRRGGREPRLGGDIRQDPSKEHM
jgi:hypothetical protein